MNKFSFPAVITLFFSSVTVLSAQQIGFGVQAGLAPGYDPGTHQIFVNRSNPVSEFTFNTVKVHNAIYIGGFAQIELAEPFFFRAEAIYNQATTDYRLNFLGTEFPRSSNTTIYSETVRQIDLPVSIGVDLGVVNVTSGFTTHLLVSQNTELDKIPGYERNLDFARFGFHSGLTMDFYPVRFEVRYVMDFFNYADHLAVNGQSLGQDNTPGRMIGLLSYQF